MFMTKLRIATAVVLALGAFGASVGLFSHAALADKPAAKPAANEETKPVSVEVTGVVMAIDAARNTVTLHAGKVSPEAKTYALAADVRVLLDDGSGDKLGFNDGKPADLTEGSSVTLRLSPDGKVIRAWVEGPTVQGILKSADAAAHTITAIVAMSKVEPASDKTFPVAKNAKVFVDDGKPVDKTKPAKALGLADLPADAVISLKLSADRKVVGSIRAEGQTVTGVLKAADQAKRTVTLTVSANKTEPGVDKTFSVDKDAAVSIEDGKSIDKSKPVPNATLADLPAGAVIKLRLALDQRSAVAVRAVGATAHGTVKAVDAAKSAITLFDKVEGEKSFTVMKDAPVFLDGTSKVKTLADIPAGSVVDLSLLADQKTVREIRANGPTVAGAVRGNAANDSITIADKEGEQTYVVAKDARIVIDKKKPGKLAELIDGTAAELRLSADKSAVLEIRAEGPSFRGSVKAIDVEKNLITLTIGAKNGVGGEDKEFKLSKDTVAATEALGAPVRLTDLPDKEVVLRLSIDQKAAARIVLLGQ